MKTIGVKGNKQNNRPTLPKKPSLIMDITYGSEPIIKNFIPKQDVWGRVLVKLCDCRTCEGMTLSDLLSRGYVIAIEA